MSDRALGYGIVIVGICLWLGYAGIWSYLRFDRFCTPNELAFWRLTERNPRIRRLISKIRPIPGYEDDFLVLATRLYHAGRFAETIRVSRTALKLSLDRLGVRARNDSGNTACFFLVRSYVVLNRQLEAQEESDWFLKTYPERSTTHGLRALVLYQQGLADEAISEYKTAIALAPEDYWWHRHLSQALTSVGRKKEAQKYRAKSASIVDSPLRLPEPSTH